MFQNIDKLSLFYVEYCAVFKFKMSSHNIHCRNKEIKPKGEFQAKCNKWIFCCCFMI